MISAIVLAGGSGKRMGRRVDKLMIRAVDRPLLAHALLAFERCPEVDEIILVARKDRREVYRKLAIRHRISKLATVISGGVERQDSVWRGLQAVSPGCKIVAIHDGARALVTAAIISRCVAVARQTGAAIPACRVKDTIKRESVAHNGADNPLHPRVETTVERACLWAAQTPQTFLLDLIQRAYEPLIRRQIIVTDDAAAVERLGQPVALVESDPLNLKITTPGDLLLAAAILRQRRTDFHPARDPRRSRAKNIRNKMPATARARPGHT